MRIQNNSKPSIVPSICMGEVIKEVNKLSEKDIPTDENKGLFTVKPANKWIDQAKIRPIPQMLFDSFWFEGELCILFADTNLGKSILGVQIANSISKRKQIPGFGLQALKQKVLLFDFELSDKQFEARYSKNFSEHFRFDNNFLRSEINPDIEIPEHLSFEDFLIDSIEIAIKESDIKVVIIDNITYLSNETEKAKFALPLMKKLKAIKSKYGISILVLAHTPKRDLSKILTRNDLQGSKMLINFCDSCFAIGESMLDKNIRYLKQIKSRNTDIIYDGENVCVCQIDKPDNFLQFSYLRPGKEREHLRQPNDNDRESLVEKIKGLHKQKKSLRKIAEELNISHMTVSRTIKNLEL